MLIRALLQFGIVCSTLIGSRAAWGEGLGSIARVAPSPNENPITPEKVALGKQLFFDTRLSSTHTISCNTCHRLDEGSGAKPSGTDNLAVSIGVFGAHGSRNSPTVWNSGLRETLFWDGRAKSLEEQAKGPIMNPVEMGMPNGMIAVSAIQSVAGYRKQFKKVFHPNSKTENPITIDEIAMAIAAFERTLMTPDSPFDRYQRGDLTAMDDQAIRGWGKFQSLACVACHSAPTFAGRDYFVRFPLHEAKDYDALYGLTLDAGRFNVTHEQKDRNLWRVPSLRNVALTGPYFHNGSVDNLEEAIRIMAKAQLQKTLSDIDVKDIVAFFKSLTGVTAAQTLPKLPK